MAPKRLTRADFKNIQSSGARRIHGRYFTLSVASLKGNNGSTETRIACVVSKKTAPRAVDRNLIKRRTREAVRHLLDTKSGSLTNTTRSQENTSLIFYVKKEALSAPYKAIESDVHTLLSHCISEH
ncbi:MAG TPA: ribonuclease P protein component [Candidatus Paceibacterota bacterium]|nr:ribonuclease P protein component [Candidatus Paceibacterota bacterium]